jgi:hypothetical protein
MSFSGSFPGKKEDENQLPAGLKLWNKNKESRCLRSNISLLHSDTAMLARKNIHGKVQQFP